MAIALLFFMPAFLGVGDSDARIVNSCKTSYANHGLTQPRQLIYRQASWRHQKRDDSLSGYARNVEGVGPFTPR